LLNIVKPKFFLPVHGEYRHLSIHGKLAQSVGIPKENIFVMEDGMYWNSTRPAPKLPQD